MSDPKLTLPPSQRDMRALEAMKIAMADDLARPETARRGSAWVAAVSYEMADAMALARVAPRVVKSITSAVIDTAPGEVTQ